MRAIIVGNDPDGVGTALEEHGVAVAQAAGTGNRDALTDAGVADADLLVVTDVGLSTSIPVAREANGGLRVVVYSRDSVPEFARTSAELILDPELMSPETVADELT
jgi:Trk K+ transport system NAD-binding subunit